MSIFAAKKKDVKGDKDAGDINIDVPSGDGDKGNEIIDENKVFNTLVTRNRYFYDLENYIADETYILAGSFPKDYDFIKNQVLYLTGMSVPPVVMANISEQIYLQWLSKLK